jgi:HEAT repeat protein
MTDEEEIASLLDDMRSGDEDRLLSASIMLAQFGAAAVPGLLSTLASPHALTRDYSALSLGLIRPPVEEALPALCQAAFDISDKVRFAAVAALERIGKTTPEVMACLGSVLSDPNEETRQRAKTAIRNLQAANSNAS